MRVGSGGEVRTTSVQLADEMEWAREVRPADGDIKRRLRCRLMSITRDSSNVSRLDTATQRGERRGSAQDEAPPDGPAASGQRLPLTQLGPASAARWVEQPEKLQQFRTKYACDRGLIISKVFPQSR